jgi:hypothetical protein
MERRAEAVVEGLVAIDGNVWRKIGEPLMMLTKSDDGFLAAMHLGKPSYGQRCVVDVTAISVLGPDATRFYRLDAFDEFRRSVGAVAVQGNFCEDVELHDPRYVDFDPEANAAARLVEQAMWIVRPSALDVSRPFAELCLSVACDLQAHETSGTIAPLERAVRGAAELLEGLMTWKGVSSADMARVLRSLSQVSLAHARISLDEVQSPSPARTAR